METKSKSIQYFTPLSYRGFTLMELLVVMAVMMTAGGVITSIFFTVMRGTQKQNNVTIVRQNGSYAISQISKKTRYATSVAILNSGTNTWETNCPESPAPATVGQQLRIVNEIPNNTDTFDEVQTTYQCGGITISQEQDNLNDPSDVVVPQPMVSTEEVEITSCEFTCSRLGTGSPLIIGIDFHLQRFPVSAFVEDRVELPFVASVTMRNIQD